MFTNPFSPRASLVRRAALVTTALAFCARAAGAQDAPQPAAPAASTAATPAADESPASVIEVGLGGVGDGSYKAGEYNGLADKGALAVGNLDLRSSTRYDGPSALRWSVKGSDLGLDTRRLYGQIGRQGKFRVRFDFDELRRDRSDTYQTPYLGAGTNVLTLPSTWVPPVIAGSTSSNSATTIVSARGLIPGIGTAPYLDVRTTSASQGALLTPNATQTAQVNAAAAADLPAFQNFNLYTTRTKFEAGFDYHFNDRWGVDGSVTPEHKEGTKPMGTVSANTGSDISTVIPDRIDNNHNQVDTNLNYKGTNGFAQVGYYGSFFTNNVPFMSWQNWATGPTPTGAGTVNVMSSAPSNAFSQISGSAGYKISSTTRFVANGSYGRATQNDTFLTDASTPVVPVSSLNGLVVNTLFNAKLTTRLAKKLNLTAVYKYNDHDDKTPVNIYQYADAGALPVANTNFPAGPNNPLGAVVAQNANANRPYSSLLNQANVDADYALGHGQWIKAGYDVQRIDRACYGSWIDCVDVDTTNEQTARAEWRISPGGDFTARVGYAYSARRGTYNENAFLALVPYANVSPVSATGGATALSFMNANNLTGYGPPLGFANTTGNMNVFFSGNNALSNTLYANNNRISEIAGFERYYVADRNRDKVRTSLSWQANETWSVQAGVDLNRDRYPDTTLGLQNARGWASDIDLTYSPSDNVSATLFYTYENFSSLTAGDTYTANSNASTITNGQPGIVGLAGNPCDGYTTLQQRNNNNKIDPCLLWSANALDGVHTLGVSLRKKAGKLDLLGNLSFSRARSDNNVAGGNWANNLLDGPGAAPTTFAAVFIPATPYPTVTTDTTELRLSGTWAMARAQSLRLAYAYLRMSSSDYMYAGMQTGLGTIAGVLPSNEQPFNYRVNVVTLSYLVGF